MQGNEANNARDMWPKEPIAWGCDWWNVTLLKCKKAIRRILIGM